MEQKSILTKTQKQFLEFVSQNKFARESFTWTGGTVLAEFYLKHRRSHDIDLFSQEEINVSAVNAFLKKLSVDRTEYQNYLGLHTYFLTFKKEKKLKVDFSYYPFPPLEKGGTYLGIRYDSLTDLIVNKIQTIGTKPRSRDFFDIYYYAQEYQFELADFIKKARLKFDWYIDPLAFGSKLTLAKDISDRPLLIKPFDEKKYQQFYLELIDEIRTKTIKR
ncbi:nucleotidyl transferase AbiEii/AbiGii toxin family protein [Patescibacteria group bacterium]|nr:nucleotidyl transferase AbiEii/AbiGii toxin family protein [Patescibacteria group bacterium]